MWGDQDLIPSWFLEAFGIDPDSPYPNGWGSSWRESASYVDPFDMSDYDDAGWQEVWEGSPCPSMVPVPGTCTGTNCVWNGVRCNCSGSCDKGYSTGTGCDQVVSWGQGRDTFQWEGIMGIDCTGGI
jgi:hypothetical protein